MALVRNTLDDIAAATASVGRTLAELHEIDGWTWAQISDLCGRPDSTVRSWARPFRTRVRPYTRPAVGLPGGGPR